MQERRAFVVPGPLMLLALLAFTALGLWLLGRAASLTLNGLSVSVAFPLLGILALLAAFVGLFGFFVVQPNQARVLTLFGRYVGTVRKNGWFWTNPFTARRTLSLRIRNFNSERLKVNDAGGNPIEIAAVVVWRVVNTASAVFDVEDYLNFVAIQTEAGVRHLASRYPYDAHLEGDLSLRGNADEVAETLQAELASRLQHAGVEVLETRLSHLAYAPEIAGAMLQRQQASAIVAARATIVAGAVGMVEEALRLIGENNIVELDEERKAQMVSNLLVVLTSERGTQPVVNAGSLY